MPERKTKVMRLSEKDLDFLVESATPEVRDRSQLKKILREDEDFRASFIGDEKVFQRTMDDEESFLRISPNLFFEILLRKAANDLRGAGYTVERTGSMRIPVFDAQEVVSLMTKESLTVYLADMLSSFTKIESYSFTVRAGKGFWKKIQFNDLDIQSLMSLCEVVEEAYRLGFYKRIADICLFVLGIFPDFAEPKDQYPVSGQDRPRFTFKGTMRSEDYEEEGRKFYKLAAEHQSAIDLDLSEIFWDLHGNFEKAKKPLNFISEHYLQCKRDSFFV
jgi:hypothetical protein